MNTIFSRRVSFLLSLAAFAVVGNGLSAQAETINTSSTDIDIAETAVVSREATPITQEAVISTAAPVPGTTATSAAPLTPPNLTPQPASPAQTDTAEVAQVDIDPGRPTFGGNSYIGIAANIGIDGNSALGDANFTIISKIGLTTNIAVRPSAILGDDAVFLIPATFDFAIQPVDAFTEALPIAPYVGGGIAISTGDNDDIGPLITAGVDFPLTPQFTATAAVNVGFLDETDIGLLIGVGYNFTGLGF